MHAERRDLRDDRGLCYRTSLLGREHLAPRGLGGGTHALPDVGITQRMNASVDGILDDVLAKVAGARAPHTLDHSGRDGVLNLFA